MKFTDIIALAKMGYSPQDIREFRAWETKEETHAETAEDSPEDVKDVPTEARTEEHAGKREMPESKTEDAGEEIKKLKEEIRRLQAENTRRARPEPEKRKSDTEIIEDMARRFM